MSNHRLFLSSGKLLENSRLLAKYMKLCKERGLSCEKLLPSSSLLSEIKKMVEKAPVSFEDIVKFLQEQVSSEVDCGICIEAYREIYGISVDCESAKKALVIQLAGWLVEILDTLGYVKIKYTWKP